MSRSTLGDSRLSLTRTPSRDYLLQNSNHSLTGRAQPPSPNMQNISSNGSSRTNLTAQPQVGAPSQALGGASSEVNQSPQVASPSRTQGASKTDPAASSSNKQDGKNPSAQLSNQNSGSNNIQKDSPPIRSSSSSRRISGKEKIYKLSIASF